MSIYTEIPYIPENTDDPVAALNLSLRIIRALTQTCVISMTLTAPPGSVSDGDKYIVGSGATGDWAGMDGYLAEYVAEGDAWDFFEPGTLAKFVINLADGKAYFHDTDGSPMEWVELA